ncbi:MAG: chromosome segregation protein SMC [bacterium]
MYLESLDIHGFKSFGKKTQFIFTDGISAIVGPNGCGKSNIVDAIRWVLGEQKSGLLRSERMENVIFNGSKSMKPLGMAEVSLTIQNTKNVLPIEYSEVVITRRLFRSSESQYLINHSPCRLKDILNLFMDTGIGPDAYSIIELSMVESILNGRAEDRRRIFEEAAGVTKYKMRRKAAFRKLEATEADLVRLNDIISEVEKNVASLGRQVRKAQRYQKLKELVKEKEIQLATHQFSKIRFELEPLFEKFKESQDKRAVLTTQFDEKEAEIEASRLKLLEIERNLSAQQKKLNELSLKIQKKEEQILVGRERRKALDDAKERFFRDKEELKSRIEKTQVQEIQSKEKLQLLFQKIQESENDFQEKNVALKATEKRVQEKKEKLKVLEDNRLKVFDGLTESKKEEERLKTHLEHIEERIGTLNRELEENELLEKIRADKASKILERKTDYKEQLNHIKDEQKAVQKKINSLEKEKEAIKEKILERRGELQTLKERIELLKKYIDTYEDHPEGVQHLLLHGYLNGGCKGTLAEILTVESEYRRAIETALGEAAVSLIVEGTDQALQCIEELQTKGKGAVTFFPLEKFTNGSKIKEPVKQNITARTSEGVIDWACNLVQCNSDYRPLVETLLNEYLVVSDLETAKQQAERLHDHRINLITLNGEIISTWGPIKGGANGSYQSGVIGRKALVEELQEKSKSLYEQLEKDEQQLREKEHKYQIAFNQEQDLAKRLKDTEVQIIETEVQLAQLNYESQKEKEARERTKKERNTLLNSQNELRDKIKKVSPSLNDLIESKVKFDAELHEISNDLVMLDEQLKEQRAVTQDSKVKLAGLKGDEKHLQEEISRLQEFKKELDESLARMDEEIRSASTEYEELAKRIEENKSAIQEDFEKHQELESTVHKIEQELSEGKEKLEGKEKFIKEIRNEKEEVSEAVHSLELRVSELKMEGDKIKDRIKEDYNFEIRKKPLDETLEPEMLSEEISTRKKRLKAMEPVNLLALKEYEKEKSRLDFLTTQKADLIEAESNINETIKVINKTARERFSEVFEKVRVNFIEVFKGFFETGQSNLRLDANEDPLEAEIIIEADPKGRRIGSLSLLSGGEKALTAISLLFAIYLVKPSPFCILDEVDAPLDDANIGRFIKAIRRFSDNTQFIIVTHNKLTMEASDCLYGVTMEEEGISNVVSVKFADLPIANDSVSAA